MREGRKRSLSTSFERIGELCLPKEPLDLVISHKYSLIIVSCISFDELNDDIMAFDLITLQFVGYLECKIKALGLCLEENFEQLGEEALYYSKNSHVRKHNLRNLVDMMKTTTTTQTNNTSNGLQGGTVVDANVQNNSNDEEIIQPLWTSSRQQDSFGMCIDYGETNYSNRQGMDIEKRRLFVVEHADIVIYWSHSGQIITTIRCGNSWGIRMNDCGDLIYSVYYNGYLELIRRAKIENHIRMNSIDSIDSDRDYSINEGDFLYSGGVSIDPVNGNIIAALYSAIAIFSPHDGVCLSYVQTDNAQGCYFDDKRGTLYIGINGGQDGKKIAIYK